MPETAQASRGKQAKARIRQAFTKLLREKPIQRIAVKELCQEAGVNRSTFYAHYQDIYDLLTKIEEDMLEDFQRALAPLLEPGPEAISPLEITRGIYRCLHEYRRRSCIGYGDASADPAEKTGPQLHTYQCAGFPGP